MNVVRAKRILQYIVGPICRVLGTATPFLPLNFFLQLSVAAVFGTRYLARNEEVGLYREPPTRAQASRAPVDVGRRGDFFMGYTLALKARLCEVLS